MIKKAKTGTWDRPHIHAAAAFTLRFLQVEKQKQIYATGLTDL